VSYPIDMKNIKIWTEEMGEYKLLDSGNKEKLEEIGGIKIVRNEPRAWWEPELSKEKWKTESFLKKGEGLEAVIDIGLEGIKAKIRYKKTSKHIGIFPEQFPQWQWIFKKITDTKLQTPNRVVNVLNLFGYTGMASLVATKANAKVTHVDASKPSVDWARENQKLSKMEKAPIRWVVDDVVKFIKKEKNRGIKYDCIIMDPPSYGKGPKGEVWKIEKELPNLLLACREILSDQPLFIIFNMYSTELSSISVANLLSEITKDLGGTIESGELALKTTNSNRLLPMSIFALWN